MSRWIEINSIGLDVLFLLLSPCAQHFIAFLFSFHSRLGNVGLIIIEEQCGGLFVLYYYREKNREKIYVNYILSWIMTLLHKGMFEIEQKQKMKWKIEIKWKTTGNVTFTFCEHLSRNCKENEWKKNDFLMSLLSPSPLLIVQRSTYTHDRSTKEQHSTPLTRQIWKWTSSSRSRECAPFQLVVKRHT